MTHKVFTHHFSPSSLASAQKSSALLMEQEDRSARNVPMIASCLKLGKVLAAALLIQVGSAEEESILSSATVVDHGYFLTSRTPTPSDLIGDNFKTLITCDEGYDMMEMTVDLGHSVSNSVISVFLQNLDNKDDLQYRIHVSHFRIGDDSAVFSTTNSIVRDNVVSGGFFEFSPVVSG